MSRGLARLLSALALLLMLMPAHCAGLQQSFRASIANLLQAHPGTFAAAQSRLIAKHASHQVLLSKPALPGRAQVALQLGADHPELVQINKFLDDIVAQLDLQDAQSSALLSNKTAIHAAAVEGTRQVNATLAVKETESSQAAATCSNAQQSQATSKGPHTAEIAACTSEMTYIDAMTQAMNQLKTAGKSKVPSSLTARHFAVVFALKG